MFNKGTQFFSKSNEIQANQNNFLLQTAMDDLLLKLLSDINYFQLKTTLNCHVLFFSAQKTLFMSFVFDKST